MGKRTYPFVAGIGGEVAPIQVGAGANGTWTYSGSTTLTLGDIAPGTTQAFVHAGNDDGDFYVERMVFSASGADNWEVVSFIRNGVSETLDTVIDCDGGEDFVIGVDEPNAGGADWTITLNSKYTDGLSGSMSIEMYDGAGTLVETVTVSATVTDPYVAAAEGNGTNIAVYSPAELASGTVLTTAAAMEDVSTSGEGDLIATLTGSGVGTWSIETTNAPGVASLSKVLKTTRLWFNDAHAITALFGSDVQTVGYLVRYVGTTDAGTMVSNINQSAGAPLRLESIGSNAQVNMSDGVTFNMAVTGMSQDNWYYVTVRRSADGSIDLEVTDLEGGTPTLGDHGTNSQGAGSWDAAEWQRFTCGGYGAGTGTMELTGVAFWSDRLSDGQLQNVIDGI